MPITWVAVAEAEGEDPVEISTEPDGTMLLTSVTAQFPGSTGLRFRNPDTGGFRGVRCHEGVLHPPSEEDGWGAVQGDAGATLVYYCVRPKASPSAQKRKLDDESGAVVGGGGAAGGGDGGGGGGGYGSQPPNPKLLAYAGSKSPNETTDLIVLGLPFKTTEEQIRTYFAEFGDMMMCQLKKHKDGSSRGYAFVRFKTMETQKKALQQRHLIDERWCDIRVPESQEGSSGRSEDCKIFVARLSEIITEEDLKEHFGQFGEVTDVFYPKTPFKGFAFVSFVESKVAQSLIGMDHVIKGISIQINAASPKHRTGGDSGGGGGGQGGGGYPPHPPHGGGYGPYPGYGGYGGYGGQAGKGPAAGPPHPPPPHHHHPPPPGSAAAAAWRASPWAAPVPSPWAAPPPPGAPGAYPGGYPGSWEAAAAASASTYNAAAYHNKSAAGGGAGGGAAGAGAAGSAAANPYGSRPGGGYY